MQSEKELFELAKMYVMLSDELNKELSGFEFDEVKDNMEQIRNTILTKGYDVNKFMHYQQMYRTMSIGEYFEFIKTLE